MWMSNVLFVRCVETTVFTKKKVWVKLTSWPWSIHTSQPCCNAEAERTKGIFSNPQIKDFLFCNLLQMFSPGLWNMKPSKSNNHVLFLPPVSLSFLRANGFSLFATGKDAGHERRPRSPPSQTILWGSSPFWAPLKSRFQTDLSPKFSSLKRSQSWIIAGWENTTQEAQKYRGKKRIN